MNLLYIKGETNISENYFSRITMAHHAHKLAEKNLKEDTCELLFLDSLFISDNTYYFPLNIEDISFLLYPQIVEADQNLELQSESSTNIRTDLNKANLYCNYKLVEFINLVHCRDSIYVPQTLRRRVIKWYHCYLQHPGGDIIAQTLTIVCRWSGKVYQERKICRIYK